MTHRTLAEIEDDIVIGALRLDDAIIELADANRVDDIVLLLSIRASMAQADALRLLSGAMEQPAALLCRAAGLNLNGYSSVLRMRRRHREVTLGGPAALLNAYLTLARLSPVEILEHLQETLDTSEG